MKNVYLLYGLAATLLIAVEVTSDDIVSCTPDPLDCIHLADCPIFDRIPSVKNIKVIHT